MKTDFYIFRVVMTTFNTLKPSLYVGTWLYLPSPSVWKTPMINLFKGMLLFSSLFFFLTFEVRIVSIYGQLVSYQQQTAVRAL